MKDCSITNAILLHVPSWMVQVEKLVLYNRVVDLLILRDNVSYNSFIIRSLHVFLNVNMLLVNRVTQEIYELILFLDFLYFIKLFFVYQQLFVF